MDEPLFTRQVHGVVDFERADGSWVKVTCVLGVPLEEASGEQVCVVSLEARNEAGQLDVLDGYERDRLARAFVESFNKGVGNGLYKA